MVVCATKQKRFSHLWECAYGVARESCDGRRLREGMLSFVCTRSIAPAKTQRASRDGRVVSDVVFEATHRGESPPFVAKDTEVADLVDDAGAWDAVLAMAVWFERGPPIVAVDRHRLAACDAIALAPLLELFGILGFDPLAVGSEEHELAAHLLVVGAVAVVGGAHVRVVKGAVLAQRIGAIEEGAGRRHGVGQLLRHHGFGHGDAGFFLVLLLVRLPSLFVEQLEAGDA